MSDKLGWAWKQKGSDWKAEKRKRKKLKRISNRANRKWPPNKEMKKIWLERFKSFNKLEK